MTLSIINFPHPTLRLKAQPIKRFDAKLKQTIADMFDLMYERRGVGLAANQVGIPLRFFIANPTGERGTGEEFVFLNPELSKGKGNEEAEEGCLSLPGLHANVNRNKSIYVSAFALDGTPIESAFEGFLARIIQHETDHLDGVLFIDRLSEIRRREIEGDLEEFYIEHEGMQREGKIAADSTLVEESKQWLTEYC